MPILNIEIIGDINPNSRSGLADRLANAAGSALDSRPQGTWVKLHYLASDQYSENEKEPSEDTLPVIVSMIQAELPTGSGLQDLITKLTDAVAACVDRPRENIHIILEPPAKGRIAFGGQLRS